MTASTPLSIRLDRETHDWLAETARHNERSISAEIRFRLQQARQAERRQAHKPTTKRTAP